MNDRESNNNQTIQYIQEAIRLIEENKLDIDSEVGYMKGYARDSADFRKLSEQYECLEGALEGLNKALFNLLDVIW